jgi:hypothetical protein
VAIAGFISPKHDNLARLRARAPADEKRSQCQSAILVARKGCKPKIKPAKPVIQSGFVD